MSSPIVAKYARYFAPGARLGGRRLLSVACIVDVVDDAGTASLGLDAVRAALSTPAARRTLAKELRDEIARSSRGAVRVKSIGFGPVIRFQAGQDAFRLTIRIATNVGPIESAVVGILVDFKIRNVTPSAVVGTPRRGSTLTVDRGRWAGGPSSFTYQWNHCDAAGANCAAIASAVGQTDVPGTADAGMRLTVTVTGTNSVSSSAITSVVTDPVS